jgi:serine/threonine protein kinase/tetratricopeptide (TPR) repeat protein
MGSTVMPAMDGAAPADPDWKGTARYEIVRRLGAGGMGIVYQAFDRERGQNVALKTLLRFDPASLYRFKQEFRALAGVHHRNLVHLYEFVMVEGAPVFFTMELVEGVDFLECVHWSPRQRSAAMSDAETTTASFVRSALQPNRDRAAALPATPAEPVNPRNASAADFDKLRPALRQLVEGLQALHAAGKLHRDVKPSNVMVTKAGRVVLLDFGVAIDRPRASGDQGSDEAGMVGTPRYMSPEQASSELQTPASDWYSVGVMLYEAIVGHTPFVGSTIELLMLKTTVAPTPPSECVDGVPPDLDALCRSLLRIDPAERPNANEILRSLGSTSGLRENGEPERSSDAPAPALVGRDAQLRALDEAFEATRGGLPVTVRVGGRGGMGKSALAQHFVDDLVSSGRATVLCGRAYERESVPYKAIDGVVDELSRHLVRLEEVDRAVQLPKHVWTLARLFPVLQRVASIGEQTAHATDDTQRTRRRAFVAFRDLLALLARRRPLVVFIDDVQWGDTDSVALLVELMRPPRAVPILLVLTYREEEAATAPFLMEMSASWPAAAELRDVQVGPLEESEAHRMALSLLGASDDAAQSTAAAVVRESGGSPLLIEELVRSRRGERTGALLGALTLEQMVSERLGALPLDARRLAEVVAVAGRPLPVAMLATASGIGQEVDERVTLLQTERFVRAGFRDGSEVIEPIHDRIRETIVGLLSADALRERHGRLAAVLEATPGADLEAIAVHLLGAGDKQRGAERAELAAEHAASKLAFDQAARLFRLALDTLGSGKDAQRLRVRLAQVLERAGRASNAADAYREAALATGAIERIELETSAAEQLVLCGRVDEGGVALRRVLAAMGERAPRSAIGAVFLLLFYQIWLKIVGLRFDEREAEDVSREDRVRVDALRAVSVGLRSVDVILGTCMQARHMILAMRVGDRFQVLAALGGQLVQFAVSGGREGKRERATLEAARTLAARLGADGGSFLEGARGSALYMRGRYREALVELDAAARRSSLRSGSVNVRLFAIYSCYYLGRLREEARRAARLLRDAEDRGDVYTTVSLRATVMVDMCLVADDADGARRHLREAMAKWTQNGFHVQHWYAMLSEAGIALYVGDGARAYATMAAGAPALKKSLLLHARTIRGFTAYYRACCAIASIEAGANRRARVREAGRLGKQLEKERGVWGATLASLVFASAANAAGARAEAIESLRRAIAHAESAGMALHAWAAGYQLGSLLGSDEGKTLISRAQQAMAAEGVRAPARLVRVLVPGRWEPDPRV